MGRMKNILAALFMAALTAMSLTSCLDSGSSDDGSITDEQKKSYALMMQGSYAGKLYYFDKTTDLLQTKMKKDSIQGFSVRFNSNMSFTMYDVPAVLLVKQLEGHEDIKEAAKEVFVDINGTYEPYVYRNNTVGYYFSEVQPVTLNLTYGGSTHSLKVYFLQNTVGAWQNNITEFNVFEYGVSESTDSNGNPVWIDNKAVYPEDTAADDYQTRLQDACLNFSNSSK